MGGAARGVGREAPFCLCTRSFLAKTWRPMSPFARWLSLVVGVLLVGTALFLISWDIPAPVERIERELSDDRFPR